MIGSRQALNFGRNQPALAATPELAGLHLRFVSEEALVEFLPLLAGKLRDELADRVFFEPAQAHLLQHRFGLQHRRAAILVQRQIDREVKRGRKQHRNPDDDQPRRRLLKDVQDEANGHEARNPHQQIGEVRAERKLSKLQEDRRLLRDPIVI